MARCDTTERIAAPPSRVWKHFRPDVMQSWYGPEIHVESGLEKGKQIQVTGRGRGKEYGYSATITEYAENRMLAWEGSDGRMTYRVAFLLSPKEGETVVLLRDEFHLHLPLGRLLERLFVAPQVAKVDRKFLRRLKALAEEA